MLSTHPTEIAIASSATAPDRHARLTLAGATLGFFMITLDAVIVNVALPSMRNDLGGGISGLQWVVDGYTVTFAGLLLVAGVVSDRLGAKRAFAGGMVAFTLASAACVLAPAMESLVTARVVQGAAAAVMMPSAMALVSQAFPDRSRRTRAVAIWAMGGAVASSSGPVLGGLLTLASWRWIFAINLPVGLIALWFVTNTADSRVRNTRFHWSGAVLAIAAMGSLTFAAIEAGVAGLGDRRVVCAFGVAAMTSVTFVVTQRRSDSPIVPRDLAGHREVVIASVVGFAFIVGYYGLPFVMGLFLQEERGLSSFQTGMVFVPMMLVGAILTPHSARVAERLGSRRLVAGGLALMTCGLLASAVAPWSTPIWAWAALMTIVGLSGPAIMPPTMALLLSRVPDRRAGTASGVFNTSRQLGGALAIAVFGALLGSGTFHDGMRLSLLLAAFVAAVAVGTLLLLGGGGRPDHVGAHGSEERKE